MATINDFKRPAGRPGPAERRAPLGHDGQLHTHSRWVDASISRAHRVGDASARTRRRLDYVPQRLRWSSSVGFLRAEKFWPAQNVANNEPANRESAVRSDLTA